MNHEQMKAVEGRVIMTPDAELRGALRASLLESIRLQAEVDRLSAQGGVPEDALRWQAFRRADFPVEKLFAEKSLWACAPDGMPGFHVRLGARWVGERLDQEMDACRAAMQEGNG